MFTTQPNPNPTPPRPIWLSIEQHRATRFGPRQRGANKKNTRRKGQICLSAFAEEPTAACFNTATSGKSRFSLLFPFRSALERSSNKSQRAGQLSGWTGRGGSSGRTPHVPSFVFFRSRRPKGPTRCLSKPLLRVPLAVNLFSHGKPLSKKRKFG